MQHRLLNQVLVATLNEHLSITFAELQEVFYGPAHSASSRDEELVNPIRHQKRTNVAA